MSTRGGMILCIVSILAGSLIPDVALACSCAGEISPPCGSLVMTGPVFVGTVQSRREVPPGREHSGPEYLFEFLVVEPFSGVTARNVTVQTATDTAACGYPFEVGRTYLVYPWPDARGVLRASICSRTRPIEDATHDLDLLRHAARGETVSRVFGRIVRHALEVNGALADSTVVGPVAGIPVVARRGQFSVEAATDGDGRFVFNDLPPGHYQIEPRWPRGLKAMFPLEPVEVGTCGAGDIDVSAVADRPLWGTVRTPDGTPAGKGVVITAIRTGPRDGSSLPVERSAFAFTDERGEFEFDGLPAGRYIVGVNVFNGPWRNAPYLPTFHPSGSDMAKASPVDVMEGRQVRVDLRLSPPLQKRSLSGIVVDEQGVPVAGALVDVGDLGFPYAPVSIASGTTDSAGRFEVQVLDGRPYGITASSFRPARHGVLMLPETKGDVKDLRVILRPAVK